MWITEMLCQGADVSGDLSQDDGWIASLKFPEFSSVATTNWWAYFTNSSLPSSVTVSFLTRIWWNVSQ
jgi:hypothetical protein